jgi:galactonate dehydratase
MRRKWPDLPVFAPQQTTTDRLSITGLHAWRIREPVSHRRYTVVRLESRGGHAGYGEGGPSLATDIVEARAAVVGRRANESEFIRHRLAGLPAMEAAVNNALLDLAAKTANIPIYQYLGGPTRFKVRLLAHVEGKDEESLIAPLTRAVAGGFKAFSIPIPARDPMMWQMQAYVDVVLQRVERLRNLAGAESDLVLDAAGSLMPGDAAFIATALERNHLMWFDEPTSVHSSDGLGKISAESVMPIGIGRHVHDIGAFQSLLRFGCVDVLRPSLGINSLAKIRRMAAIAEIHYVAIAPFHAGGPIASVAAIHLAASLPNFYIQQIPVSLSDQDAAMRAELTSGQQEAASDGFAALANKPGLGVQVDEKALAKYSEETL